MVDVLSVYQKFHCKKYTILRFQEPVIRTFLSYCDWLDGCLGRIPWCTDAGVNHMPISIS